MKVIVGVDDSPFSREAIRYVASTTWPKMTRFIVVSAAAPAFVGPGEAAAPGAIAQLLEEQERFHSDLAQRAAAELKKVGFEAEARMVRSDPRTALEEEARREGVDLIVIGSHGRSGIKKILLGSVATHIVTHAPCSVLVVKSPA